MKSEWNLVRLGDIADVQSGGTPLVSNPDFWNGDVAWYSSGELNVKYTCTPDRYISQLGIDSSNAKLFPKGSLLIGMYDTAALKMSILDRDAAFNQAIAGVRPNTQIDLSFIQYAIDSHREYILGQRRGVRQKNLSLAKIRDIELWLPPLTEQQRIVAIIDEAFEAIAAARTNAEHNRQNARALFESYLQSVFSQRGDGWRDSGNVLSSMCELIVDCEHKTAPTQDEGFPSIRTPNIGKGKLLLDNVKRVSEETYLAWTRRAVPLPGDLIFAREAPAGNVAVVPDGLQPCLGQRTVLIRPKKEAFDSLFLTYLLLSPSMQEHLLSHSKGATVQHINMKDIRALRLGCIPPIREQRELARRITDCSMYFERLESLYQRKIAALDELKQSLLQQAFSGQL